MEQLGPVFQTRAIVCLGIPACGVPVFTGAAAPGQQLGPREGESLAPTKDQFPALLCVLGFPCEAKHFSLSENICLSGIFSPLCRMAKAMFVCLNSETVIDIDEVLLLLADHYTACICWVPLHIIMM